MEAARRRPDDRAGSTGGMLSQGSAKGGFAAVKRQKHARIEESGNDGIALEHGGAEVSVSAEHAKAFRLPSRHDAEQRAESSRRSQGSNPPCVDRKSGVYETSGSVRVDIGGRRLLK